MSDRITTLINRAHNSPRKRTRTKADRINALVDDLRSTLRAEQAQAHAKTEAQKEVERLEVELAVAKARVKNGITTTEPDGASAAEVRRWAVAHNIDCGTRGRVPATVRSAYQAAQEPMSA